MTEEKQIKALKREKSSFKNQLRRAKALLELTQAELKQTKQQLEKANRRIEILERRCVAKRKNVGREGIFKIHSLDGIETEYFSSNFEIN